MHTKVLLIRHGVTQSNKDEIYMGRSDEDIAPEGYSQIEKLSARLKKTPLSAIYSSPMKRTQSSAKTSAKPFNIDCETLSDLIEIDLGAWHGLPKEQTKRDWPEIWEQILLDPGKIILPQGESFKETMNRSIRAFKHIIDSNPGKCVAAFTHDIIIKMIVMHVLNAPTTAYNHFQIDCTSVTTITASNDTLKLIELNNTSHLAIP